jgi:hypothetical protein
MVREGLLLCGGVGAVCVVVLDAQRELPGQADAASVVVTDGRRVVLTPTPYDLATLQQSPHKAKLGRKARHKYGLCHSDPFGLDETH